jgi:hypothetical protein
MIFNRKHLEICKYVAPSAEVVYLQLEGIIADSTCPRIKDNKVWYEEYATENLSTPVGQDVLIF